MKKALLLITIITITNSIHTAASRDLSPREIDYIRRRMVEGRTMTQATDELRIRSVRQIRMEQRERAAALERTLADQLNNMALNQPARGTNP